VVSHYPRRQLLNLERKEINSSFTKSHSDLKRLQQKETIKRYQFINDVLKQGLKVDSSVAKDFRSKLDRVLTSHMGLRYFLYILFIIFQSILNGQNSYGLY
jgi:ferrous iron transport protein B